MADELEIGEDGAARGDGAARCVMAVRQMMRDTITADLVVNPAIDMLLALYLRRNDGAFISAAQICDATGAAAEVCRRWGLALQEHDLVDIDQGRYRLTDHGRSTMRRVNQRVWQIAATHMAVEVPPTDVG